jgi:hypothetical protein
MGEIGRNITWRGILIAALAAGTAHLLINMVFTPLVLSVDPQLVLRYFASLVLGDDILMNSNPVFALVGVIVHYAIALVLTLVIVLVVHRWGMLVGIVGGAVLGLAFYLLNLYTMTVFFPWFFAINSSILLASHVVFGVVAGGVYEFFDHYDQPLPKL